VHHRGAGIIEPFNKNDHGADRDAVDVNDLGVARQSGFRDEGRHQVQARRVDDAHPEHRHAHCCRCRLLSDAGGAGSWVQREPDGCRACGGRGAGRATGATATATREEQADQGKEHYE
jgi:hypothetical protein